MKRKTVQTKNGPGSFVTHRHRMPFRPPQRAAVPEFPRRIAKSVMSLRPSPRLPVSESPRHRVVISPSPPAPESTRPRLSPLPNAPANNLLFSLDVRNLLGYSAIAERRWRNRSCRRRGRQLPNRGLSMLRPEVLGAFVLASAPGVHCCHAFWRRLNKPAWRVHRRRIAEQSHDSLSLQQRDKEQKTRLLRTKTPECQTESIRSVT